MDQRVIEGFLEAGNEEYINHHSWCEWPRYGKVIAVRFVYEAISCSYCGGGWSWGVEEQAPQDAMDAVGVDCHLCGKGMFHEGEPIEVFRYIRLCNATGCDEPGKERYLGGITTGYWCDKHYDGPEYPYERDWTYDYMDAGEYLDDGY